MSCGDNGSGDLFCNGLLIFFLEFVSYADHGCSFLFPIVAVGWNIGIFVSHALHIYKLVMVIKNANL